MQAFFGLGDFLPTCWDNLCFDVTAIHPRFITCYDLQQEVFIFFWMFKQFSTILGAVDVLVIRHQAGTNFVPTRSKYLSLIQIWYLILFSKVSDVQMLIYVNKGVDFVDVWIASWCGNTSRTLIVFSRLMSIFKTSMPLKTCCMLYTNVTVSHLEHINSFRS